ncbi:MAG: hypothetical protein LQ352_006957 [Teloschistes flavicans]|nr:MAG: hypothetical protein LQ352_006957 [Teloschistes flavicans]
MVTASTDPGIATTPTPQTAPAIQQGTVHPSPGSVATFAPVAMTKDPSKDSGPTLSPDPPSSEGPSSKSNPLSSADPPSNAEPPSNEDPRPSIPKSNAAEHTTPTETEALASSYATENPSRSPFLVATVGSQQIYALPNGAVAVQGKTIKPDDPAITVDGTPISVGLSSIYVGGSAFQIPPSITALDPLPSTLNDKPIEAAAAGAVLLGEQMISEGQVTTVDGSRISNGQDRIVIGSTTFAKSRGGGPVPASLPTPPPMLNGKHIDAATAGGLLFDGQMISEGQAMTVDGYTIFNGHDRMIIDSITFGKPLDSGRLPTAGPTPLLSAIDGKSLEYDGDDAPVLDGHTISSGQQTTIDGKDVAITAGDLVVDGTTYALPRISHTTISKAPSPSSMNNNPLRFDEDGNLVYDGRTMSPGQQTTINGKHVVIEPSDVVIDSTTYPLSVLPRPTAAAAKTTSPLTQINGEEVRFDPEGEIVIGGSTMSPDQQTTVQGVYISAGHGRAVVGSHTYSSAPSAANTLGGPGVVTPSSIFGGSEASLAIPTLTASGAAATAQAGDSPISSAAGKDSPSGEPGLGAIILAALEDMPSQTQAGASPAAASQTSSNVTAGSVTPFDPSSNSGVMASSISFWIGSAVTGFAMLVLPL